MDKKDRLIAESSFVFSLWKAPKYYKRYQRMIDNPQEFFRAKATMFFYQIGIQMFERGFVNYDEAGILSFFSTNASLKEKFDEYGGITVVLGMMSNVDSNNHEGFYNSLVKDNCISQLKVNNLITEDDLPKLQCMDIDQIRLYYLNKVNTVFYNQGTSAKVESMEIDDEDLQTFHEGLARGIPINTTAPLLNYEMLGINKGLTFLGAMSNVGKTSFIMGIIIKAWCNNKVKSCIISNEQTLLEFKQLLIAMVAYEMYGEDTNLIRRRVKIGKFDNNEWFQLKDIQARINETYGKYIKYVKLHNYDMEDVQLIIDLLSARGYTGFVYDVFKADEGSNKVIEQMKDMSKALFRTLDNNEVSGIATIQLGLSFENVRYLHMGTISTSKQIVEPATEVLLMRQMWEDEITDAQYDIHVYNYLYDEHGNKMKDAIGKPLKKPIPIYEDEYEDIILVFLSKTRNSKKVVIAYKFNGDYNIWEELGYCNPKRENRR